MGKVQAEDVYSGFDQFQETFAGSVGWADGRNNFRPGLKLLRHFYFHLGALHFGETTWGKHSILRRMLPGEAASCDKMTPFAGSYQYIDLRW